MSRFRLYPTPQQVAALAEHCTHARYVWNLAVEQLGYRRRGQRMPSYVEQSQQLAEARRVHAARNIAAGHAVTARGGLPWGGPVNREPQHAPSQVA